MHFREQGKSLQLVRTTYNPAKGRGEQTVVAKLPQYTYTIPDDVRQLLTADEVAQLTDYLAALEAGRRQQANAYHLRKLTEDMTMAVEALKAGSTPSDADAIWTAMADMAKALKKAGYPKPKARNSATGPAGQTSLDV